MNRSVYSHRGRVAAIAGALAVLTVTAALVAAAPLRADDPPSFGTIPDSLLDPARDLEQEPIRDGELPDYIVVWARDGSLAGYVSAEEAYGKDGSGRDGDLTVVNRDLEPVGLLTPNGFVAHGEQPADVPEVTVTTLLGNPASSAER